VPTPSAPGLYVTFAHPAADVAGFLERRPAEWREALKARGHDVGWVAWPILGLGLAAPFVDVVAGFGTLLFTPLVALALFVCVVLALSGSAAPELAREDRARDLRDLLLALAGDLASGRPVSGHLDLTGPEQKDKVVRVGRSARGVPVRLYRDEWCRLKLSMRDGSQIRLSTTERRKSKDPVRKRRRVKPGTSTSVHTVELRLAPNPALYRVRPPATAPGTRFGALGLVTLQAAEGVLQAVATVEGGGLPAKDVLQLLAHLYGHLERAA
jgi:hypothetical protein